MCCNDTQCSLLGLPPELRKQIYQFCFIEASQTGRSRPVEPPITYVSRAMRSEVLPIFYSHYTLMTQTYVKMDFYGHIWLTSKKWYHSIHPDKVKHIIHFKVRFILVQQYTGELVPLEFQAALHKRCCSYVLTHCFDRAWIRNPHRRGDPADFEEVVEVLHLHLKKTLDRLLKLPGIGAWTAADIDQLAKVDPDSLPLQTMS